MTFSARSRDTIRDEILGYWSAEYSARGKRLLTSEGSDAWVTASALAVVLEAVDAQAAQVALDILPDEASTDALNRHGSVNGVDRRTGVKALVTVTVTGPVAGPFSIPAGTQMVDADSAIFNVENTSVTLAGGSPTGTLTLVRSALAGAAYTPSAGDTLTFVSAPTGLNSTGTVAAAADPAGTDDESDDDYRERIIATLQDRPASGNRADWKRWAEEYTAKDIRDVWVYSLLQPPTSFPGAGTEDVLGCVTVVVAGPAQGDSTTNTRLLNQSAGTKVSELTNYVNGDVKADGSAETTPGENQRRPVTMSDSDFAFQVPSVSAQAVVATVTVNAANAATWSGSHAITSSTTSSIVVAGDQSALVGSRAIVNIGTSQKRGGYTAVTLQSAVVAGSTTFTLAETLAAAPTGTMYPVVGNWEAIRLAAFAFFDALGPGETTTPSRFPGEEVDDRATLYPQALAAAIMTVDGVLSCSVTTPAASVVPAAKTIVTLDTLRVTP